MLTFSLSGSPDNTEDCQYDGWPSVALSIPLSPAQKPQRTFPWSRNINKYNIFLGTI